MSARSIGGGRIHDALIAACTLAAGANVLLTWNVKDFLAVAPQGLEVRQP
jgi:predicted nucleic acid-binding protein